MDPMIMGVAAILKYATPLWNILFYFRAAIMHLSRGVQTF